jgi:hypothetical protein
MQLTVELDSDSSGDVLFWVSSYYVLPGSGGVTMATVPALSARPLTSGHNSFNLTLFTVWDDINFDDISFELKFSVQQSGGTVWEIGTYSVPAWDATLSEDAYLVTEYLSLVTPTPPPPEPWRAWLFYAEIYDIVGAGQITVTFSPQQGAPTITSHSAQLITSTSGEQVLLDPAGGSITADVSGRASAGTDMLWLELRLSRDGVVGQVTMSVAVDGATRYTTTLDGKAPPALSSAKDITSFKIGDAVGTISGTSIAVTVPYSTNVTSLTPTITHSGVSISPAGAQDFSKPVSYTVTAEDGTTKSYLVTLTRSVVIPITVNVGTWTGKGSVTITVDADLAKFVRLMLDGKVIDAANYTLTEGSTIITLKEGYLKTLADGDHSFTAEFTDGTAVLPLTVKAGATGTTDTTPNTFPQTGDGGTLALGALLLLSGTGGTILILRRRPRA